MANGYVDILPRGLFTPYIGAGIGFAYNDVTRSRFNQEIETGAPPLVGPPLATNRSDTSVTLAAALMAGVSFSFDQRWVLDVSYRAQYVGGDTSSTVSVVNIGARHPAEQGHHGRSLGAPGAHRRALQYLVTSLPLPIFLQKGERVGVRGGRKRRSKRLPLTLTLSP